MTKLLEMFTNSLATAEVRLVEPGTDDAVTREALVTLFAKDLEKNQTAAAAAEQK